MQFQSWLRFAERVKLNWNCKMSSKKSLVVVYTDGSCRNNKVGIGVHFPGDDSFPTLEYSGPVDHPKITNQVAELSACIKAIEIAKEKDVQNLLIRTDSEYVVKSMTQWIKDWKKHNWKRKNKQSEILNKDLIQKMDTLSLSLNVQWEHVPREKNKIANDLAQKVTKS